MDPPPQRVPLWTLPGDQVLAALGTSSDGLTQAAAAERLLRVGPNEVARGSRRRAFHIFLSQFASRLVLVLVTAAAVSYLLAERVEAAVIVAIVVLNAALGFAQEYRAERALSQLQRFLTHVARVRRDGRILEVPARELVPGDVVRLEVGDMIPADVRLLAADDFACDEAALTGESLPVAKGAEPRDGRAVAFLGTSVAGGYAEGVVVATGRDTALGGTAAALEARHADTDFQRNIRRFSDFLFKLTLGMTAFVFIVNAVLARGLLDSFLFAVALAVGITPEALPVIVTIALSRAALRMAKAKVVIKRLMSVEDLGNIDALCCDKTGTLTRGEVALADYADLAGGRDPAVVLYGLLASAPPPEAPGVGAVGGGSIDQAIWRSEAARQVESQRRAFRIADRNAFDFERRRMSVLAVRESASVLVVKGAADSVLAVSTRAMQEGEAVPLSASLRAAAQQRVTELEEAGYRVIAVAEKAVAERATAAADESGLTLRGFLMFLDPPKAGARDSLALLRGLGVRIKVMSGDSPVITRRICREVGLTLAEDRVVTGAELEGLDEERLREVAARYDVFARLTPDQKRRLVTALRAGELVVGFLGDGINDAPALRAADVGIAVDSGTGIAKEAADVILLEKSLGVLADGIMEGRRTFGNIIKYILNTISANFGNMATVALSSLFLRFIPLLPSQILLNNFISDLPLVAISTDRVDEELLKRPRHWRLDAIARFMVLFGLLSATFDLALIVGLLGVLRTDVALFRTVWFVESACSEILVTFAIRTRLPFYRSRPAAWLIAGSLAAAAAALALPFVDQGQRYFSFVPIPATALLLLTGVLVAYFLSAELAKRPFFRHFDI